jgi:ABC-type proline/glycine betaine transport system permease subunit
VSRPLAALRAAARILPLAGLALVVGSGTALGCPQCAGRDGSALGLVLLGAMIVSPFAVVAIAWRAIRRVDSGSDV